MEQEKCKNPKCIYHIPVAHAQGCVASGASACQSVLHKKECWTQEEKDQLVKCLDHYIQTRYPE